MECCSIKKPSGFFGKQRNKNILKNVCPLISSYFSFGPKKPNLSPRPFAFLPSHYVPMDKKLLRSWWKRVTTDKPQKAHSDALQPTSGKTSVLKRRLGSPPFFLFPLHILTVATWLLFPIDGSIFSTLLETSIQYACVNISYADESTKQQCYGQIPCIVAKCGAYLKDQGTIHIQ